MFISDTFTGKCEIIPEKDEAKEAIGKNLKEIDTLVKEFRAQGLAVKNDNEKILIEMINEKLAEMFGTGQPMEQSRRIIMDGVMDQIRKFNENLSHQFMTALQRQREQLDQRMQEHLKNLTDNVLTKMLGEFKDIKVDFLAQHERAKREIMDMRAEFMNELKDL